MAGRGVQWLTDERGRRLDVSGQLMDEGRKPEMLQGSHSMLVPLNVQIEQRRPEWLPVPWASTVPCLLYPVPEPLAGRCDQPRSLSARH